MNCTIRAKRGEQICVASSSRDRRCHSSSGTEHQSADLVLVGVSLQRGGTRDTHKREHDTHKREHDSDPRGPSATSACNQSVGPTRYFLFLGLGDVDSREAQLDAASIEPHVKQRRETFCYVVELKEKACSSGFGSIHAEEEAIIRRRSKAHDWDVDTA